MFILTSLWEVVAFTDLVVQRSRTHNRKPSSKFLKTHENASARGFDAHFSAHVPKVRGRGRSGSSANSRFGRRNFWIAYKEARSPGFFCLVWRRWFATGLPSPRFSPAYVITSSCSDFGNFLISFPLLCLIADLDFFLFFGIFSPEWPWTTRWGENDTFFPFFLELK